MALQHQIRLAISDEFFDAYSRLPRQAQGKVSEFINRFRQDPTRPGLNYEQIQNGRDKRIKSVRIDQAHRAVVLQPEEGNIYILLWVDKHDDAYAWAKRRVCNVNRVSGALQILDVEDAEATTEQLSQNKPQTAPGRFDDIKDKHLLRLGVPEILLSAVRQVVTDEEVEQLIPHLPKEASDALVMLAAGYELDEVLRQLEKLKEAEVNPDDLEAALENDDSRSRFMVITDDTELEEMLAAPLEKWRVFLHPSQRKLVARDWNGAVRVLGGAGTGKTVVAMHRAKWLAHNRFTDPNDRILFTTFTRNLAVDIEANLKSICPPDVMRRIKVVNLDAWVSDFFRQEGVETRINYDDDELQEIWKEAYTLAPSELGLSLNFYQEEWRDVICAQGCQTMRDYLKAKRTGRGTRLSRQQRQGIWPVFEEYRNLMKEKGLREPEDAMRDACQLIATKGQESLPYKAVIVDEAQDMSEAAFMLIRAIVGEPRANDLFIVGDAHQRIYGKFVTLSHCGIDIRGRARKLRLNYRTTDEIRRWASAILEGVKVDDLDGGQDSLNDYRSLMHGEDPLVRSFSKQEDELRYLQELLQGIQSSENHLSTVCIVVRTNSLLEQYETALTNMGFQVKRIQKNQPDNPQEEGLRIGTMHRVKGLQFDYMLLPGLNHNTLPLDYGLRMCADEASQQTFIDGERCLLHVAATRAKKQVITSYYGKPSELIESLR